ncbi:MAG: hypothetical protein BWK76_27475 [Desulfobulbaceae bacterium A2]|nr:MAG: hypothetical protein BWK76_27475 [Desulfobulbaceae bacterium A2]
MTHPDKIIIEDNEMDSMTAFAKLLLDDNFLKLNNILKEKTIFDIFGVENKEVPFTRLLAWLLDPHAGHQMGVVPIKSFLRLCIKEGDPGNFDNALRLEMLNLSNINVTPEYPIENCGAGGSGDEKSGRLDIYVESSEVNGTEGKQPLLLIEAKIGANQGDGQLSRYKKWMDKQQGQRGKDGKEFKPVLIYLTPEGENNGATDHGFVPMNFTQLNSWLDTLKPIAKSGQAEFLINELYCLNNRTSRATDDEMIRLADKVRQEHSQSCEELRKEQPHEYEAVLEAYEPALSYIGVVPARQGSLGYDEHINVIKEAAEQLFKNSQWTISGGQGSLTLRHKLLQDKNLYAKPGYRVNFDCWLDRAKNYLELAVYSVNNNSSGVDKVQDQANRKELVVKLRDACKNTKDSRLIVVDKDNFQVAKINLPRNQPILIEFAKKQLEVLSKLAKEIEKIRLFSNICGFALAQPDRQVNDITQSSNDRRNENRRLVL